MIDQFEFEEGTGKKKKIPVTDKEWFAKDGSIFVVETKVQISLWKGGPSVRINPAIAFNVGDVVAHHIVETHNAHVKWRRENSVKHYVNGSDVNDTNRGSK
jgi:hypothetical protein